jgi:hypothetical protein
LTKKKGIIMARGGFRPGAGRPKGATDKKPRKNASKKPKGKAKPKRTQTAEKAKIKEMLEYGIKAKAQFYQEFLVRIGRGEQLTVAEKKMMDSLAEELAETLENEKSNVDLDKIKLEDPDAKVFLEQLLMAPVTEIDLKTKIQVANMLLPFQHPRVAGGIGKKEDLAERAKKVGAGKFSSWDSPLKAVK